MFKDGAQPFIQWVPSTGREPQSIGEKWGNRLILVSIEVKVFIEFTGFIMELT